MKTRFQIGQIWGIPLHVHLSWFLIFGLVSWSLATGYLPQEYPSLNPLQLWLLGGLTALFFFGSVLAHELGHAWLALRNGVPVRGITLFLFGGVAELTQEPRSPGAEFRIAIAGPLVSLGLTGLFASLWLLDQAVPLLAAPSLWLARINLSLALFNLIPGFPLDGGRVLRALVWKFTGHLARATQIASGLGQLVAFGFIGWGVYTVFQGQLFNGLWLAFIGWFLQNASAAHLAQSTLQHVLDGMRVEQVMRRDFPSVPNNLRLQELVETRLLTGGEECYLVTEPDSRRLKGLLTMREVTAVPRADWAHVTTGQVMLTRDQLLSVQIDQELVAALRRMEEANVGQAPVLEGVEVRGLLSHEQVLNYLRRRAELGL